jgi:hypothetical protein
MWEEKQKVRCLEIQCSGALLPAGSMGTVGMAFWDLISIESISRDIFRRYIIRLKSDINNKSSDLRAIHVTRGGKWIYALSFHLLYDILLFPLFLFNYLCIDSLFAFCTLPLYLNLVTLNKTLVKRINKIMWTPNQPCIQNERWGSVGTLHTHLYKHKCVCILMSR